LDKTEEELERRVDSEDKSKEKLITLKIARGRHTRRGEDPQGISGYLAKWGSPSIDKGNVNYLFRRNYGQYAIGKSLKYKPEDGVCPRGWKRK